MFRKKGGHATGTAPRILQAMVPAIRAELLRTVAATVSIRLDLYALAVLATGQILRARRVAFQLGECRQGGYGKNDRTDQK